MKFQAAIILALSAAAALAIPTPASNLLLTIETAPGETKQVTEEQKWELHNVSLIRDTTCPT